MNARCPLESAEQANLFRWAAYESCVYPELALMYHIPNGGSRNKIEAHNLRLQGVKKGVPDVMLPVARGGYHGLYIEMKREKGGRLSDEQKEWVAALVEQGYAVIVAHGFAEAQEGILKYLKGGEKTS